MVFQGGTAHMSLSHREGEGNATGIGVTEGLSHCCVRGAQG